MVTTGAATQFALLGGWLAFVVLFARHRPHGRGVRALMGSARGTRSGFLVQACGFATAFWVQRPNRGMVAGTSSAPDVLLAVLVIGLMSFSIWIAVAAVRALGRYWALGARVVDGHELLTTGPFALVRHPIYAGLAGMLVATGLAISTWWALVGAIAVYGVGTAVRVRAEEAVLLDAFGADYEAYRARVPAVVPWRGVA